MSDEIPPPFKTMGTLEIISVGLGFYCACRGRHTGPQFFTWAFLEEVESGNSNGTSTITGSSTGRNGKQLKSA